MPQNTTVSPSASPSQLVVVLTSLPNIELAKALAHALLEEKLAACVQLIEGVQSIYRWEGKVREEREVLLSAKTSASHWIAISSFIQAQHPYDLPEILAFSPEQYEQHYGEWVQSEVNSKT
jgi:periplasmic divalent cation tolerance protein